VASWRLFTYPPDFDSAVTAWGDQSRAQTLSSHGWRLAIAFSRCGQTLGIVKLFAIEGVIPESCHSPASIDMAPTQIDCEHAEKSGGEGRNDSGHRPAAAKSSGVTTKSSLPLPI
jgi:hypothetical protein